MIEATGLTVLAIGIRNEPIAHIIVRCILAESARRIRLHRIHLKVRWIEAYLLTTVKAACVFEKQSLTAATAKVLHELLEGQEPGLSDFEMHLTY